MVRIFLKFSLTDVALVSDPTGSALARDVHEDFLWSVPLLRLVEPLLIKLDRCVAEDATSAVLTLRHDDVTRCDVIGEVTGSDCVVAWRDGGVVVETVIANALVSIVTCNIKQHYFKSSNRCSASSLQNFIVLPMA